MANVHTSTAVITIERFIMEQERLHPEATGELSNLLYDLCLAAKIISRQVRRAGLSDILGAADSGAVNVSGDLQQKLDLFARDTVRHAVQHTGRVCIVASEEDEQPMLCPKASRRDIRTPPVGKYYSVNESNWNRWTPAVQRAVAAFKNGDGRIQAKNARYIGSLVADFHRNLISGGIFLYPGDSRSAEGKLRLLYEAAPLALVVEQAGGLATDGHRPILALVPKEVHQKTPVIVGSKADVGVAGEVIPAAGVPT